jgi:UDP-N-acetylmuramate dehydrogenase
MPILADVVLAEWCTLGVGGPARWFCQASDEGAVIAALRWAAERQQPVHVLGGGSNVVFADRGFDGLVLHVGIAGMTSSTMGRRTRFSVGAGEAWDPFVADTIAAGCAGLECLSGIPGTVGGTPVQNVGAYGQDVSGTIARVHTVDRASVSPAVFTNDNCEFGYRVSRFKRNDANRYVVTHVEFDLAPGAPPTIEYADLIAHFEAAGRTAPSLADVREAVLTVRRRKGMVIEHGNAANQSVGSFFVNPIISEAHLARLTAIAGPMPHYRQASDRIKVPAAWLIERAGFVKGLRRGTVGISPFQAQAIVNLGGASAQDVVQMAIDIKHAVWNTFEIALVPEPVFVGFADSAELRWLLGRETRVSL